MSFKLYDLTMYFKMLCAFFTIFITFQGSYVQSFDLRVLSMGDRIINQRIASRIPYEAEGYTTTSCGGVLTRAPGAIKQHFQLRESANVECTWRIQAPADHSIYIRKFEVRVTSLPGRSIADLTDSVDLQIYEGNAASSAKRLFDFKHDSSLDKCISNGHMMTVVLKYAESGLHAEHEITVEYGFADRSEISDLLN